MSRIFLFGIDKDIVPYYNTVKYGQLEVEAAVKEGKAATLLADAIFNSSLVMCEQIECGKVDIRECRGKEFLRNYIDHIEIDLI